MKAVAGILAAWVAAAAMASRMPAPETGHGGGTDETSAVSRLFGSSREVISRQFYVEADRYFHKGVSGSGTRAFEDHVFVSWADAIAPRTHEELEGRSVEEIMPWLHLATRADPGNVEAYSTAAYWLHNQGDVSAAKAVLLEAERKNPGDYRVAQALGLLYYRNDDHALAVEQFERARVQWPAGQDPSDRQTQLDLSSILSFRASLHERLGHRDRALAGYREIVKLFPGQTAIRDRLHDLEHGHEPEGGADAFWSTHLASIDAARGASHMAGTASGEHVHHEGCSHGPAETPALAMNAEEHDHGHHEHHAGCEHAH